MIRRLPIVPTLLVLVAVGIMIRLARVNPYGP